jgi:hypothetical protein
LGIRDSRTGSLVAAVVFALVVHVPLTPFPFILRWLSGIITHDTWDYQDGSVIVPISLADEPAQTTMSPVVEAPSVAVTTTTKAKPRAIVNTVPAGAAGVVEVGVSDAGRAADARRWPDAGAHSGTPLGVLDGGDIDSNASTIEQALSLLNGIKHGHGIEAKPNVSLFFWLSSVREHALGDLLKSMLVCNPAWRESLGDQIDPLQDIEAIMLAGPRMSETSKLTMAIQLGMGQPEIDGILDALAQRPGSSSIDEAASSHATRFFADRADRVALTHPRKLLIVTTSEGFEQLRDLRTSLSFPSGKGRAMSLTMVDPWRPLQAVGAKLPETLTEMRLSAYGASDGGVDLDIEFDDRDAASAEVDATEVTTQVRTVGGPLFSDIEFVVQANHLGGEAHFSPETSNILLGFIRERICPSGTFDGGRSLD